MCALDWSDKDTYRHNPYYDVDADRGPILVSKTVQNIESKSDKIKALDVLKFIESVDVEVEGDCSCAINDDLNRILISNIDSTCRSVNNSANIRQKNEKTPTSSSIATTTATTTNIVENIIDDNIRELDGTSEWDVIIGADVVWLEELVPHLVNVLVHLIGPNTVLLLSHQKRSERTDLLLFSGLSKYFVMEMVITISAFFFIFQFFKCFLFQQFRNFLFSMILFTLSSFSYLFFCILFFYLFVPFKIPIHRRTNRHKFSYFESLKHEISKYHYPPTPCNVLILS